MSEIFITFRTNKLEKLCNNKKEAIKEYGLKVGSKLIQRKLELEAFSNLQKVPVNLPWRREKLKGFEDRWSIRVEQEYRIEIQALDLNDDLSKIENIKILEVSKHYE